jgi:hypothetical protein
MGYKPNSTIKGCTLDLKKEAEQLNVDKLDAEVRTILKRCKNNPEEIIKFIQEHKTNVYKIKRLDKILKFINEEEGFISERTGMKAVLLNYITTQTLSTKSEPIILLPEGEVDIYNLIHYFHKWCAFKDGMSGFDEKSQTLLRKFNTKNEDKLIQKLSLTDIELLKSAIARDVQSISFVSKYSKENAGAKNALEKLQTDDGASI